MQARKLVRSATIGALTLLGVVGIATAVRTADLGQWGQGFPWLIATPRVTPYVLSIGEQVSLGMVVFPATPTRVPPNVVAPSAPAPVSVVTARNGDSPTNALSADGVARSLNAGASVWYKIGNGGDHMDVSLDANSLGGMSFSVFAPGNLSDSIGQGTMQAGTGHLVWAGGHWNSQGDWLARVSNSNRMTVQYTLTSSAHPIGQKSCYSYWENLPTGIRVYWTECER